MARWCACAILPSFLRGANIGASGHHIISQGEADRVLSATRRERREMLEDALGLTAYLYKREEAKRKLEKTAENMREVEGLRRELAPHLQFLGTQVKKIEESQKLRDELAGKYLEYLKRESVYLRVHEALLKVECEAPEREQHELNIRIANVRGALEKKKDDAGASELVRLEDAGRRTAARAEQVGRELGRIEGEISAAERAAKVVEEAVPAAQAREFASRVQDELEASLQLPEHEIKNRLAALIILAKEFMRRITRENVENTSRAEDLTTRKDALGRELEALKHEESRITNEVAALRAKIENEKDASREAERELFAAMARRAELEAILARQRARHELLSREREELKSELGEAGAFIGRRAAEYEEHVVRTAGGESLSDADSADEPRAHQEERRKKIERMKIRLEEVGLRQLERHTQRAQGGERTRRIPFARTH